MEEKAAKTRESRYNLDSLEEESVKHLYETRLDEKLNLRKDFNSLEKHYDHIKECLHLAAQEALGLYEEKSYRTKPCWWDKEIAEDIVEKDVPQEETKT